MTFQFENMTSVLRTYTGSNRDQQPPTATAEKWADRYRAGGQSPMIDRSSRPHRGPHRLPQQRERRIVKVRFCRQWGRASPPDGLAR